MNSPFCPPTRNQILIILSLIVLLIIVHILRSTVRAATNELSMPPAGFELMVPVYDEKFEIQVPGPASRPVMVPSTQPEKPRKVDDGRYI